MPAQSTIAYLRDQLRFTVPEWGSLTDADKAQLKQWAAEEMTVLGIEVKA